MTKIKIFHRRVTAPVDKPRYPLHVHFRAASAATAAGAAPQAELPAPVDTTKTYKANKDDTEETFCEYGNFDPTCYTINNTNMREYLSCMNMIYYHLVSIESVLRTFWYSNTLIYYVLLHNK